jgi:2-aminoadipate transaminase
MDPQVVQGVVGQAWSWSDAMARRTRGAGDEIAAIMALSNASDVISFSGGFPDPATFPGEVLADLVRELVVAGDASALQYTPTQGLPGTRAFLRERLGRLDGHQPAETELAVTSGGIDALGLISKTFLDTGDQVLVEAPSYLGAIMAFRGFEAAVGSVGIDDGGLLVDVLADRLGAGARPKLLYVIPDHQNPAGVSLAAERRVALIELARRHGVLLVEDVAYRELAFDGGSLPSLLSLGPDVVVQIGTFSKTFFPGVRLGWVAGPAEVVARLVTAKQNSDQCAGALGQRLLEAYGRRGLLDRQIVAARELYRRRCELLLEAMDAHMPEGVRWTRPRGGFFSWVTLPAGTDATELARKAMAEGVAVVPGTPFFPDAQPQGHLRLSFSRVDDDLVAEGVRRLGAILGRRPAA